MKDVDCQVFGDQLEALVEGTLPEEGRRQLLLHAETCPDCAMELRVHRSLVGPTLEELEARIPEGMVEGMWGRVKEGVEVAEGGRREGKRGVAGSPGRGGLDVVGPRASPRLGSGSPGPLRAGLRAGPRWVVPALAAASLVLFFSTGALFLELGRLRDREALLAQQVVEQRRWLAELEAGPSADPVARTAALAGKSPWLRALSRQETISIEGLRRLLERVPGDRMVMTQEQWNAALRSRFPLSPSVLGDVLARVEGGQGVRAGDLLRALDGLELSPDLTVPTSELMDLLS
jgi:hypothetical protein